MKHEMLIIQTYGNGKKAAWYFTELLKRDVRKKLRDIERFKNTKVNFLYINPVL